MRTRLGSIIPRGHNARLAGRDFLAETCRHDIAEMKLVGRRFYANAGDYAKSTLLKIYASKALFSRFGLYNVYINWGPVCRRTFGR